METKRKTVQVLTALTVLLMITASFVMANDYVGYGPHLVSGNPTCSDFGENWFEFKVEPVESGTYTTPDGYFSVTLDVHDKIFDWTSTQGVDAVFVKGGPKGNLYLYDPEATSDTGLHAPENKRGEYYGLSHISFCYDWEVDVSKDAHTSYTRTYEWTIDKEYDWTYIGFAGDSWDHTYTIVVNKTGSTDSDWAVAGQITIENNTPLDAMIESVADVVSPDITAVVDCGLTFPYLLPSGDTLYCDYSSDLPDGSDRVNTATVETSEMVGGGEATADVDFSTATITEVDAEVNISDDYGTPGDTGDDLPFGPTSEGDTYAYTRTFECSTDPGMYDDGYYEHDQLVNTAKIVETGQDDDAKVNVECYLPWMDKTVETEYTRTFEWDIDKSVFPEAWALFDGESGTSEYTVDVTQTGSFDNDFQVYGDITIYNPAPIHLDLQDVTDTISLWGSVSVTCPGYTVPAGGTLTCSYATPSIDDPDNNPFGAMNFADATLDNGLVIETQELITWGAPTDLIDESVDIEDSVEGILGTLTASGQFSYEKTFFCDADEGLNGNTAVLTTNDLGITISDSAEVDVDCYDLSISKTANPGYTVKYYWNIDKYVDDPGPISVYPGESITADYTVDVWPDPEGDMYGFYVAGNVTVTNNHPTMPAEVIALTDWIPGYGDVTLTCPATFDGTLSPGGSVVCSYYQSLDSWDYYENYAAVTQQLYDYDHTAPPAANGTAYYEDSADITWGSPTTVIDETIDVYDSAKGFLGAVTYPDRESFPYSVELTAPAEECGLWEIPNRAWFVTRDTGAWDEAFAYVELDIQCATHGCTPGFWQGGAGSQLWNESGDPDWTGAGTNPFIHTDIFNIFFPIVTDPRLDGQTMWQLVSNEGGIANNAEMAGRTMVAAYLNESAFPGEYAYVNLEGLKAEWYAAVLGGDEALADFHTKYDAFNNYGCPLP